MTNVERGVMVSDLHKMAAELAVMQTKCEGEALLNLAVDLKSLQTGINNVLDTYFRIEPDTVEHDLTDHAQPPRLYKGGKRV